MRDRDQTPTTPEVLAIRKQLKFAERRLRKAVDELDGLNVRGEWREIHQMMLGELHTNIETLDRIFER